MPRLFSLLYCIVCFSVSGYTQQSIVEEYGLAVLKQAGKLFCEGDTLHTIETLENYVEKYSYTGTALLVGKRLADLYVANGDTQKAIGLLTKLLDSKPTKGYFTYTDSCGLFRMIDPESTKADMCVLCSKIYDSLGDHTTALEYLNFADTRYLPSYGGCANGMIMYRTKLSLDFADHYLLVRDTAKAIDRLVQYFLSNEFYEKQVTAKLKAILLQCYSPQQIEDEVNKCIRTMHISKSEKYESEYILTLTFFGRIIKKSASDKLDLYRDYYARHPSILAMMTD